MSAPILIDPVHQPVSAIAEACLAHAAKLRAQHLDGAVTILPSATVSDLIVTLLKAAAVLA